MTAKNQKAYPGDMTDAQAELFLTFGTACQGGRTSSQRRHAQCHQRNILEQMKKQSEKYPRLIRIFVDGRFSGQEFMRLVMDTFGFILEAVIRKPNTKGFEVLRKRWVVERTFAWFNYWRRLSKDYEILPETSEAFIYFGMIRLLLRRLA